MYRLDWIEQLKLKATTLPTAGQTSAVSPVVWKLGFTSLLTDISAEMVNSMLPVYLVLYLHASPLAFGAIDGIYNGMAVALLGLAGGILADRWQKHREVAAAGYGLSCICKLGLYAAGAATGWIGAVTAVDRVGKGMRTAPRDALLSLNSAPGMMATSFAVHRALDAGGSLLGPIAAFLLASRMPNAYGSLWITSFIFALLGVAILMLLVENPLTKITSSSKASLGTAMTFMRSSPQFRGVAIMGGILGLATVSDAFVYLLLQEQSGMATQFFPLYYVATASVYMVLSVPIGKIADRMGRKEILLGGYALLGVVYVLLATGTFTGGFPVVPLLLFGTYYAATEGVLMAIASSLIPAELRTTGLALLTTSIGLGKMVSSVAFGWLWESQGRPLATGVFLAMLVVVLLLSWKMLRSMNEADGVE
ncbi:MAG: MFS transporter [Bryobacteraceae bacterium]